jgi:hypothetical protein
VFQWRKLHRTVCSADWIRVWGSVSGIIVTCGHDMGFPSLCDVPGVLVLGVENTFSDSLIAHLRSCGLRIPDACTLRVKAVLFADWNHVVPLFVFSCTLGLDEMLIRRSQSFAYHHSGSPIKVS